MRLHRPLHVEPDRGRRRAAGGVAIMIEPRERLVVGRGHHRAMLAMRLDQLGDAEAGRAAEHDQIDQAVRAQAVGAVDRDAGRLAHREQARHHRVRVAVLQGDDLAMIVTGDAAHIVMDRRRDGQRLARQIDAGEDLAGLGDAGQAFRQHLGVDMIEVQVDMIAMLADAAALAHLHRHRA